MTLERWMKRLPLAVALAVCSSQAAFADLKMPTMDGSLPVYPKASFGQSLQGHSAPAAEWAQVWAHGFMTEVFSEDDVAAVDRWYGSHLHDCTRQSNGSRTAYTCPGGTVAILPTAGTKLAPYGKSAIVLNPN